MASPSTTTLSAVSDSNLSIREKFGALREQLTAEVLEAEERIDGALVALVSAQHIAMIGPPGTAKTFLYTRLRKRISGVRHYQELMRKTMSPDLVFGAQSVIAMKNDEPVRFVTTGMFPEADIACLDEFPRTSDAINNGNLMILNERLFRNGGEMVEVPLKTAFLLANTLPVGEAEHDLEAFWDRVVMRFMVELPVDPATWRAVARMRVEKDPATVLDWSEVLTAQDEALALPITDGCFDALDEVRGKLLDIGIQMSPRRVQQAQYVAAAWAWLNGADEVRGEHCEMLSHMLWEQPEQRADVDRIVSETVSPHLKLASEIATTITGLAKEAEEALAMDPSPQRVAVLAELWDKFEAQGLELTEFIPTLSPGRALRSAETSARLLDQLTRRTLAEMGVPNVEKLRTLR